MRVYNNKDILRNISEILSGARATSSLCESGVRLPLIFIPLSQIPGMARWLTYCSPLTYGNDLIASAYSGTTQFTPFVDIGMLLVFILIFQFAANRLYKKFNE